MDYIDRKLAFNLVDSKVYQAIGIIKEAHSFVEAADIEEDTKSYLTQMLNFPYETLHEVSANLIYDFYPDYEEESDDES